MELWERFAQGGGNVDEKVGERAFLSSKTVGQRTYQGPRETGGAKARNKKEGNVVFSETVGFVQCVDVGAFEPVGEIRQGVDGEIVPLKGLLCNIFVGSPSVVQISQYERYFEGQKKC